MSERLTCGRCGLTDDTVLDLDTGGAYHPEPMDCIRLLRLAPTTEGAYEHPEHGLTCHVGGCKLELVDEDEGTCYYRPVREGGEREALERRASKGVAYATDPQTHRDWVGVRRLAPEIIAALTGGTDG